MKTFLKFIIGLIIKKFKCKERRYKEIKKLVPSEVNNSNGHY